MPQEKQSPSSVYLNCSPSKRSHQFSKADRFGGSWMNVKSTSNDRLSPGSLREKRNSTALVMLNDNSGADLLGEHEIRAKSTLEPTSRNSRAAYESSFGRIKNGSSPFSTSGVRFDYTPAHKTKRTQNVIPSPGEKLHHPSSFQK